MKRLSPACAAVILFFVAGCSRPARLPAVPPELQAQAEIPGLHGVRYRPGHLDALTRDALESVEREQAALTAQGVQGTLPPSSFLAISGGGDKGAFGAGLLNGWSSAGDRPVFKVVTGISTGGLIAPFAFLGPAYDARLKSLYTGISSKDILIKRSVLAAVTSDAMADNTPLWNQLGRQVNREMLDSVAAESRKGRLLLIGTCDLDARQGVIWNMTKIAESKDPAAIDLFRRIMMASAAIPGAFPPTMIQVEAGGKRYEEMHVDGGTSAQVFAYPPSLQLGALAREHGLQRERNLYVIRNSRLDPEWADVERRVLSIAGRAISSLIHNQGIGDLYRIYATSRRDSVDFHLARIPGSFNVVHKEDFDPEYMKALFDVGYGMASKGYPWETAPPGFELETVQTPPGAGS
ncbi:MAG: patatin-like phospholipase family protein [Candidatus Polarisedimenticolia bacterium]